MPDTNYVNSLTPPRFPQRSTLYTSPYIWKMLGALHQKEAVVVQWSAHPIWYPTFVSYARLPKILKLSLS